MSARGDSMTPELFAKLRRGDILRHRDTGNSYVIDLRLGGSRYVGVSACMITNPREWILVSEARPEEPKADPLRSAREAVQAALDNSPADTPEELADDVRMALEIAKMDPAELEAQVEDLRAHVVELVEDCQNLPRGYWEALIRLGERLAEKNRKPTRSKV